MSPKNEIAQRLNDFFEWIGIDPLLGTIFLGLIFCLFTLKDLKNFRKLSSFQKTMYFAIWFGTVGGVIALIIRFIREGY
jgi:uncharacterized protein YacL